MKRTRRLLLVLALSLAAVVVVVPATLEATSHDEIEVAGAAAGVFPDGSTFGGVTVRGSTVGLGVLIHASGSADGDLSIVLAGTSPLGEPQEITLDGKVTSGARNAAGIVTFSGTGTLDMGGAGAPTTVPFIVTATTNGLQLTIAGTELPTQTLSAGSIFIE